MRKCIFFNLLLVLALSFSACDEKNEPKETPIRLISRIDFGHDLVFEFEYDARNRIKRMSLSGFNIHLTFRYPTANTMKIKYSFGEDITFTLNKDGSLTSFMDEVLTYKNGYLHKTEDISKDGDYIRINTLTWNNGNVENSVRETKKISDPSSYELITCTYEYGTIQNKPVSVELVFGFLIANFGLMPYGSFGKTTLNMPAKITRQEMGFSYSSVKTFRYETDKDGYVTEIYSSSDDEDEELMMAIQYK